MAKGGLAGWSVRHPVSTLMLTLTVVVLGLFALGRLSVDLLPHIIYPQIGVRVLYTGVSATIMEDKITRQLEEQLAITEDVTVIESTTTEGRSSIELSFAEGKDLEVAYQDASARLDRAKRFLPKNIEPPIIFKRDPAQLPVMEFAISSTLRSTKDLRTWTDDIFSKRFLNLPGVASVEVGGGELREIHVLPDQRRLAGLGLSVNDLINAIKKGNEEEPGGKLRASGREYSSRTAGRLQNIGAIAALPLPLPNGGSVQLSEVAEVLDTQEDEKLRVRFNGVPGVKITIQKQPTANTVKVAEQVRYRMAWMKANRLIPEDITVSEVSDQSVFIRHSLNNATMAAISGAILAMIVVYFFLGDIRGTLIIGSAIPISIMVTFVIMALSGLTLNIMSLGGLALGVGMLIDNTIVMLENIARHKRLQPAKNGTKNDEDSDVQVASEAAAEVNSAIVASTSTNLAAVLPFLFIGGFIGLMFRELIITISAAIVASLLIAITLVPSLAARMRESKKHKVILHVERWVQQLRDYYRDIMHKVVKIPGRVMLGALAILIVAALFMGLTNREENLPTMDDGNIVVRITMDPGISLDVMDDTVKRIEKVIHQQGDVASIFTIVGGWIFGRTQYQISNRSSLKVKLVPVTDRNISSQEWIKKFQKAIRKSELAGVKVRARASGIRGIRGSRTEDDIGVRVQGKDLDTLVLYGDEIVARLRQIRGVRNVRHSAEEKRFEFAIEPDRKRAAELGIEVSDISRAQKIALDGLVVSDFVEGDRSYAIRVRLPRKQFSSPADMESILLFGERKDKPAVYLKDVAKVNFRETPMAVKREGQRRMLEITASLTGDRPLGAVLSELQTVLDSIKLQSGYNKYITGVGEDLKKDKGLAKILLALAVFLVYVVMAVQYESLRNPTVIMLCVPFSLIGVVLGLLLTGMSLSMPVWLGIIMLVGIVVNNAIVLVEYIEILRRKGQALVEAVIEAGQLRLRPILMTTLTTVVGMMPLALGLGEGSELLQPLAVTIVAGLSFSFFVSLILVPATYILIHQGRINWSGLTKRLKFPKIRS
ncbi:MAG TPA: efflux RND transporter permease subunit [Acidiferrobacteraceae bacterium]|nr:efflux RND transporter permease subunit [Acidiferrobacteraceae bacterium]HEX20226.1 efflux RND transporter permease subunit [Acidiferrobacteraceae bacterium]